MKPRIYLAYKHANNLLWRCMGAGRKAFGCTPRQAYEQWEGQGV
jgi:hypothetical protein